MGDVRLGFAPWKREMSTALLLLALAILSAELVLDPAFGLALCALGLGLMLFFTYHHNKGDTHE